jgi:signal transduction histidine kinase
MSSRHSKLIFGMAAALTFAVLAGIAMVIANSQASDRDDVSERFTRRPAISATLTSALFSATTTTPQQQKRLADLYGGKSVSDATLTRAAKRSDDVFIALLDPQGELLALSGGAPPGVKSELASDPEYVQAVRDSHQPVALSDYLDLGPGGEATQAFVQPIESASGTRLLVTGFGPQNLYAFLSSSLTSLVDIVGGQAYIVDSNGAVVASSDPAGKPAQPVPVPGLTEALASGMVGPLPDDQYFAAAPIANSSWQVVTVAPESDVFASVDGFHQWVPWLLFSAFALALVAAFALLYRVLRNATELTVAHEQLDASNRVLQRRAKELERSNAELEQFASIASHDLQEPLRKVQMFSQRALEVDGDKLSDKGRDYLRRNTEAASRMQMLIEDLLMFSRVGTQGRPFVETDLNKTVAAVISDLETTIQAADGTVEVGALPTAVVDEPQIRQLFQNLISNAIKFRRGDVPPVVRIDGEITGRFAEISVSDNGIGFDPRYATRIFRVFERLHGRGEYPGTGIGLALCRKIAERHGGSITVDSTPEKGSVFTVTLPRQRAPEQNLEPAASSDDRKREVVGV